MILLLRVRKKGGNIKPYDKNKIREAIIKAAERATMLDKKDYSRIDAITDKIDFIITRRGARGMSDYDIDTAEIHELVLDALFDNWRAVYDKYSIYRSYHKELANTYQKTHDEAEGILYAGDKENANKDSYLNSTKQSLIGESVMRTYMRKYELKPEWVEAHDNGWLHVHDMGQRFLNEINCQLFNMKELLNGGFEINGARTDEPKRFDSAIAVVGDVILTASANQYGGFSCGNPIDELLAPYAEKSYKLHVQDLREELENFFYELTDMTETSLLDDKIKRMAEKRTVEEIRQGIQGFEVKLNTINNALAQIPFTTIAFGIDQSKWGRIICREFLNIRKKGMANNVTAVFPKEVMLCKDDINLNEDSPNHDLFDLAIECSRIRLYPDFLSLNPGGSIGDAYKRCGIPIIPMGK